MENTGEIDLEQADWSSLTYAEKNRVLFLRQRETLEMFLERGAINMSAGSR